MLIDHPNDKSHGPFAVDNGFNQAIDFRWGQDIRRVNGNGDAGQGKDKQSVGVTAFHGEISEAGGIARSLTQVAAGDE
jgi:hypothetical protein